MTKTETGSGPGGGFHMSPTFSAAREIIAIISGSGSANATTPEGGNAAGLSSPERESSPSDAVINILSSGGAPKKMGSVLRSAEVPASSNSNWGETPLGEALTLTLIKQLFRGNGFSFNESTAYLLIFNFFTQNNTFGLNYF